MVRLRGMTLVVLRKRPLILGAALLGSVMHGGGHALLAGVAGMLARSLSGRPMDHGSTWGRLPLPLALAIAGVLAASVKLVGSALYSWAEARTASSVAADVRLAVLDRVLALGQRDQGCASLTALTSHVADVERGVASGVLAEARALIALVPLGVLLVVLAPRLAGSALVSLLAFGVLAFGLRRAFKRAHRRAVRSAEALVEAADEAVRHAELWATYGAARRIRAHVAGIGRAIANESAAVRVRAALLSSTSEVLGAIALALVLFLAARGLFGVDESTVIPFAIAFFLTYKPLRELVEARLERARGEAALLAAMEAAEGGREPQGLALPSIPPAASIHGAPLPPPHPRGPRGWRLEPLRLAGVTTAFGEHAPITTEIAPGSIVAVVGATGVGKTSLLRALLGLAPLRAGSIYWGDHRVDGSGVGPSERPFAWVPQDAPIVGDTLAINVGLGRADDDAEVPDPAPLLRRLGAEHLAAQKDARLRLSGGERQWVAVARALASGQPALLLDEPTSALDPDSERRLLGALAKLRGECTVVIVTHRPAPIAIADAVLRLEHLDDGARADADRVGADEVAVDDYRAGALGEA